MFHNIWTRAAQVSESPGRQVERDFGKAMLGLGVVAIRQACLHITGAYHFRLIDGQDYREDVEDCITNNCDGLRLYHGHNNEYREDDGKGKQELSIISISANETNDEYNKLNHEYNNCICIIS